MNVIILVLSCERPPYDKLYEAQRKTWDSVEVPNVATRYYFCDGLAAAPWMLRQALDGVWREPWTFVFRTNSSSYVDKRALLKFAEGLPVVRCYCGMDGWGFA